MADDKKLGQSGIPSREKLDVDQKDCKKVLVPRGIAKRLQSQDQGKHLHLVGVSQGTQLERKEIGYSFGQQINETRYEPVWVPVDGCQADRYAMGRRMTSAIKDYLEKPRKREYPFGFIDVRTIMNYLSTETTNSFTEMYVRTTVVVYGNDGIGRASREY
ncbi:hypothetical protein RUM43_008680 [Polyplax serrata]|uniref:Uncharacterized protein n=1 Tax=Polyplax serrata TaxID=468196 RepID=A0AAN8PA66_POLSC